MNIAGKKYLRWLESNKESEAYEEYEFWLAGGNNPEKNRNFYNDITVADFGELFISNCTERMQYITF